MKADLSTLEHHEDFLVRELRKDDIRIMMYKLDYAELMICHKGSFKVNINMDMHENVISEGCVLAMFPGDIIEVHEVSSDVHVTQITISRKMFAESINKIEHHILEFLSNNRVVHHTSDDQWLKFLMNTVENLTYIYNQSGKYSRYEQALCLVKCVISCVSDDISLRLEDRERPLNTYNRLEDHFRHFIKALHKDYKQSREVSYFAAQINLTPKYLNYVCNHVLQRPCKQIIDEYVVLQLKNELRNTEKPIQSIAKEYNFPNQSFLGSYFKKYAKQSPRRFRYCIDEPVTKPSDDDNAE